MPTRAWACRAWRYAPTTDRQVAHHHPGVDTPGSPTTSPRNPHPANRKPPYNNPARLRNNHSATINTTNAAASFQLFQIGSGGSVSIRT